MKGNDVKKLLYGLAVLGLLAVYTIGTFSPGTRLVTDPLTIVFLLLVSYYPAKLIMQRLK